MFSAVAWRAPVKGSQAERGRLGSSGPAGHSRARAHEASLLKTPHVFWMHKMFTASNMCFLYNTISNIRSEYTMNTKTSPQYVWKQVQAPTCIATTNRAKNIPTEHYFFIDTTTEIDSVSVFNSSHGPNEIFVTQLKCAILA